MARPRPWRTTTTSQRLVRTGRAYRSEQLREMLHRAGVGANALNGKTGGGKNEGQPLSDERLREELHAWAHEGLIPAGSDVLLPDGARGFGVLRDRDACDAYAEHLRGCHRSQLGSLRELDARALRCLVNYARAEKGLSQLKSHSKLNHAARIKSARIVKCQDFSHTACGRSLRSIFDAVSYLPKAGWSIGENIAWGSGDLGGPQARMRGWLESEGHRRNIFNPKWRDQGMGLEVATFKGREHAAVWSNEFGIINSSSPSSSATRSQLRYRELKHNFYHQRSKRPDRRALAIKWHKLVEEAR